MTPRIARTPRRQLRTIQLTFSVTARTTRQMPRTVKKMTDRRRPLIMAIKDTHGSGLGVNASKARRGGSRRSSLTPDECQAFSIRHPERLGGFFLRHLADLGDLQVAHHAERAEQLQRDPADVELVPGQAVAGRHRVRVVVVVPALAEGQERHPPAVARVVARLEAARCPTCASPSSPATCACRPNDDAQEDAPEHHRPAADGEQRRSRAW